MYVEQIYQMLQAAIRQHHKQFPFPKADFTEASEKIKLVVEEFTKDLNAVLREQETERARKHDTQVEYLKDKHSIELDEVRSGRTFAWLLFGVSLAVNIYFIFIA